MRLYHGTDIGSAAALLGGAVLDAERAASAHIDGKHGFYLAEEEGDAEFFALRREPGCVIAFEISVEALARLRAAGVAMRPIPGGRPPYFAGQELFVPVGTFTLFNELRERGEINVV